MGESLTLAASMLADPDTCLSALSIYQLTQTTCYQIPSGLRMAISGRVGNQLGAAQPAEAAVAEKAGLRLILLLECYWVGSLDNLTFWEVKLGFPTKPAKCFCFFCRGGQQQPRLWLTIPATLLLIFTRQWGLLFTQNVAVLQLLDTLVWPMLIYSSLDAVLAYIVGVLTSCGQQSISGRWAIGAYLGVSFPDQWYPFSFLWQGFSCFPLIFQKQQQQQQTTTPFCFPMATGPCSFFSGRIWVQECHVCPKIIRGFPLALLFGFVFRWGVFGLCAGHCLGKLGNSKPYPWTSTRFHLPPSQTLKEGLTQFG